MESSRIMCHVILREDIKVPNFQVVAMKYIDVYTD